MSITHKEEAFQLFLESDIYHFVMVLCNYHFYFFLQKCMLNYFLSTKEELFFMALRERMVIASNSIKEK